MNTVTSSHGQTDKGRQWRALVGRLTAAIAVVASSALCFGCDPNYRSDGRQAGTRAKQVGRNMKEWTSGFRDAFR